MWMGFGWPARGPLEHRDTAFSSLVELSTRIREARMVISQVTAWSDPAAFQLRLLQDYLAGVRTPSDLKKPDWNATDLTFCASCVGNSERWACPGRIVTASCAVLNIV